MTHSDDDKILKELYQQGNKGEPSAALDQLILQQAKQSNQVHQKRNWRPWLAAASVILVMPMIWLLVQNEQLIEQSLPAAELEMPRPQAAKPSKELRTQQNRVATPEPLMEEASQSAPAESFATTASADMAVEADEYLDDSEAEHIEDTSNGIKREEPESASVRANRELLMNEFKAKKKTLKQSNLNPLLALELQQFNQYLEQGKVQQASQLLQEMMAREPDFDYSELQRRLLDEQSNQD